MGKFCCYAFQGISYQMQHDAQGKSNKIYVCVAMIRIMLIGYCFVSYNYNHVN